ncbi:MAG: 23S rRNA (guanosine(2251)-2'-O)-methyltransferase RlmB [Thermaerobacter sp.]|nr:23S rRNA (guanosine(2251)-2'-O)-methyltransferase RlmB [Bacillota bacterium]
MGAVKETEVLAGRRPVLEALRGPRPVRRVLIAAGARGRVVEELAAAAAARRVPVERASRDDLDRWAAGVDHQGVVALAAPLPLAEVDDLLDAARRRGEPPLLLVCAEIQDPQNLGSLIRSAEAAGFHGVIVPRHRSAGPTPAVARASAGALEHLPLARVTNLSRCLDRLKEAGLWVCAAAGDAEQVYWDASLTGPLALVVGSEGRGIPPLVRRHCDFAVRIPMRGRIQALNAAVAGALIMFEIARQRALSAAGGTEGGGQE